MTAFIKEWIIDFGTWKHMNRVFVVILAIWLPMLFLIRLFFPTHVILIAVIAMLGIVVCFIWECFIAISSHTLNNLRMNKLKNIIFSHDRVWHLIVLWGIILPIIYILDVKFQVINIISCIIIIPIAVFIDIELSKSFSEHYKEKISENQGN